MSYIMEDVLSLSDDLTAGFAEMALPACLCQRHLTMFVAKICPHFETTISIAETICLYTILNSESARVVISGCKRCSICSTLYLSLISIFYHSQDSVPEATEFR